jgi:hypothetical protein
LAVPAVMILAHKYAVHRIFQLLVPATRNVIARIISTLDNTYVQ